MKIGTVKRQKRGVLKCLGQNSRMSLSRIEQIKTSSQFLGPSTE